MSETQTQETDRSVDAPTPATKIENPDKLYQLYKEQQAELKALQKTLKGFGELKPEDVPGLLESRAATERAEAEAEENKLKLEGQYAALYEKKAAQLTEQFEKQTAKLNARIQALEAETAELTGQVNSRAAELSEIKTYSKALDTYLASGGRKGEGDDGADGVFSLLWGKYKGDIQKILSDDPADQPVDDKGKPLTLAGFYDGLKAKSHTRYLFDGIQPEGNATPQGTDRTTPQDSKVRSIKPADLLRLKELGISTQDISEGKVIVQA